jgi:diguanylate cyclase (GGDEF)-like protein
MLVVEDLQSQSQYPQPPLRIGEDTLRFYAGVPLISPDGHALGTVCVLDVKPRNLTAAQREGLEVLARQTQHLLELRRYAMEQRRLLSEREAFAQRLEDARADLQRRNDLLEHSATHDALTGLLNRAALAQLRDNPDAMRQLQRAPYTLMLLDVDHFKDVNDRHGHLLGDRALRAVADAVAASIRDRDVAVRYGGEEFLILLPDTRLASAVQVAERIRQRIANAPLPFPLTVSIGLAAGEPTRDWSEQVFDRADQALYRAKAGGRNRVVVDDTPMHG